MSIYGRAELPCPFASYKLLAMKLIITEKNQAAQRIASILSKGTAKREGGPRSSLYVFSDDSDEVKCIGLRGHIMKVDFPDEYKRWEEIEPGALVEAELVKQPAQESLVSTLKKCAKAASVIIIATDYDREGELIGLDVKRLCQEVNSNARYFRARFSALTPDEIRGAFENLKELDENLAMAGEARQDIDLIWGASLTRFLSLATSRLGQRFLSAGRVQSPTLALVVEREKEIQNVVPETYWQLSAVLEHDGATFSAVAIPKEFKDYEEAKRAFESIEDYAFVKSVEKRERQIKPPAPFNTTSFLTAASNLKVSPARAMNVAEDLYSRGYISYPRVDNTVYPESLSFRSLLESIRDSDVVGVFADELLKLRFFKPTRGRKESTDHPPIHPTSKAKKEDLSSLQWKIYELVARRFLATLSKEARARSTKVVLKSGAVEFVARGDLTIEEGFLRVYPYGRKKDEELPDISEGDVLKVVDKKIEEKKTQPPPRYSEGKLIEKMEELGLGTKSTRHTMIQNLLERGYIFGSPIRPSEMGTSVSAALRKHANPINTPEMTSNLEREMDRIVEGEISLDDVVGESRKSLSEIFSLMEERKEEIAQTIREGVRGDTVLGICPACGGELRIRVARSSKKRFVGCSSYPQCNVTFPLPQKGMIQPMGETCDACGSPIVRVITKGKRPWEICLDPECTKKKASVGTRKKKK
ncbi:MAG: DNA topoisomerase I [Actinomycetota bacterium]|nr:DNA topoisomerase I [Actinomycetota bacterium]